VAGRGGEGQRQPRPPGPHRIFPGPHHEQDGQAEEERRRGMLPEGLARGPQARAQREDGCGHHGVLDRTAPADGQEEDRRGQAGEERGRHLSHDGGAGLVQGEEGPREGEERSGQDRGQHGIDRDPVAAHRARERLLDLGVLVEVEVGLLREAGRDALGGPGVPRPDGTAVRQQHDEQAQRDHGGAEEGWPHDPRRPLERLFPRTDAHQRAGLGLAAGVAGLAPGEADGGGARRCFW